MTNPTRQQWAAWLIASADEADDLHSHERHGLRLAATHMLDERVAELAASIDDLDEVYMRGLEAHVRSDVEAGHQRLARPVAASEETP